jgi:hypothetical protein
MLVPIYQSTRHLIPEGRNLNVLDPNNLKYHDATALTLIELFSKTVKAR